MSDRLTQLLAVCDRWNQPPWSPGTSSDFAREHLPDALKALVKCREALEKIIEDSDGSILDLHDHEYRSVREALAAIEQVGGGEDG